MSTPVGLSVALDDGPFTVDPTWLRLDDSDDINAVLAWNTDRGRPSEFDKTKTGTATFSLIDKTGVFDPTSSGLSITTGKQAQISMLNPVTSEYSMIFRGHITDWEGSWDISQKFQVVTVQMEDAFGMMSRSEMTPGHHGHTVPAESLGSVYFLPQAVNDRIIKCLDDIGWPGTGVGIDVANLRNIFSGNVWLQESIYARRDSFLNAIFDAADGEFPNVANIFISRVGVFTFHGRYARFNPANYEDFGINTWKIGDKKTVDADDSYAIISALNWRVSNLDLRNSVGAWPMNVAEEDAPGNIVQSGSSIAEHGLMSDSYDDLITLRGEESSPLTAVQETKQYATYTKDNYSVNRPRVTTVQFRPRQLGRTGDAALWQFVTEADLSDVADLLTFPNHPGGGGFDEPYFIEGLRYDASPMRENMADFTMEADLSPAAWYDNNPFST